MFSTLGFASDALVLSGAARIEPHDDRLVIRTPAEPDFWFGNMVVFRDPPDPEAQIARYHADFPEAKHVTLGWDRPDLERGAALDALAAQGFEIGETDVLALRGELQRLEAPEGIAIRAVEGEADWAQLFDLHLATAREEGMEGPEFRAFLAGRMATRRRQIATGFGIWLAAHDGAGMVAALGIFADDHVARYQEVETAANHRRRGICAALVCAGADWAAARRPGAVPVILADRHGPAGRIYRRCGFAHEETLFTALRQPA
ncbi:GNAT family N-acetyltransferase [Limimaricola pyoseonensis]|uniref:Acetyltransferase (GNAT) domain-containing protein n=1 Tax=Limimaricola pyoseonensis TaxID=521013 RepID=A0A1G7F2W5_9RHOB|nr:GNAT family N-acetyltransferase [Limimaricola pyoseonensis]SDE70086.1 Acetyltransferase (GNAT) domain-containing protein [Limimaricola pyoseonensis]